MPKIAPVSELRNYGQVLEMVKPSSPVYLTKNGHGVYSLHSIEDDETYEKAKAVVSLMTELAKGFGTGGDFGCGVSFGFGRDLRSSICCSR